MSDDKVETKGRRTAGKKSADKSKAPQPASARASARQKIVRSRKETTSRATDDLTQGSDDWRANTLSEVRRLIFEAAPEIVEERKWSKPTNPAGVPVWSYAGIVCTGETYKQVVKLTFARGASLKDVHGLFNASLDGNTRRAIDIREGELPDAKAFKALIQAAVAKNLETSGAKPKTSVKASMPAKRRSKTSSTANAKPTANEAMPTRTKKGKQTGVVLLSGGNPQIAKADGDEPVQAYIAAMPGWKSGLGKRLDTIIVRNVPDVRKGVRWNSPFYGIEGQGWFLSFHVFTRYVKVTFFAGASLRPVPPGAGKDQNARWIDIYEEDEFNEQLFAEWVKQAAALPGWIP